MLSTVHRLHDVYGFEEFFKGWFKGMPTSQLKDDNVKVRDRRSQSHCS